MLGLGEEVGGDPLGVARAVGEDANLGGAGDLVDGDGAVDLALGGGDVGVAGAGDELDGADAGAVGHHADGLDAANAVDFGGAGHAQGVEKRRGDGHAVAGGGAGDDFGDAGGLGQHHGHDGGGGERRGAAGDVDAHAVHRVEAFAETAAVEGMDIPIIAEPGLGEGHDTGGGQLDGGLDVFAAGGLGGVELGLGDANGLGGKVGVVEGAAGLENGVKPAGTDVGQAFGGGGLGAFIEGRAAKEGLDLRGGGGGGPIENGDLEVHDVFRVCRCRKLRPRPCVARRP